MEQDEATHHPEIAKSKWKAMGVVMLGVVMSTLDTSIVNIALKPIAVDFGVTIAEVTWVATVYSAVMGALVISFGRLAKPLGYRKIYLIGFTLFVFGSVICALAPGVWYLVAARAFQALGGAAVLSCGAAVLVLSFPAHQRGRALSAIPVGVSVGITAGPALGGVLSTNLSWHWVFWVNVPLGLIALLLAHRWFYPQKAERGWLRGINYRSVAILIMVMAFFFVGTDMAVAPGASWRSPQVIGCAAATLIALAIFLWSDKRSKAPLVPLKILKNRIFWASLFAGAVTLVAIGAQMHLLSFFLQRMWKFSEQEAGFVLLTSPICLSLSGPVSGWISDRFGSQGIRIISIAMAVAGYLLMAELDAEVSTWAAVGALAVFAVGMGLFHTPNTHVSVNIIPTSEMAHANAFMASVRLFGMAAGFAISSMVLTEFLRIELGTEAPPVESLLPNEESISAFQSTFFAITFFLFVAVVLVFVGRPKPKEPKQTIDSAAPIAAT